MPEEKETELKPNEHRCGPDCGPKCAEWDPERIKLLKKLGHWHMYAVLLEAYGRDLGRLDSQILTKEGPIDKAVWGARQEVRSLDPAFQFSESMVEDCGIKGFPPEIEPGSHTARFERVAQ